MTTNAIPILPYDRHIAKALETLNDLGPGGIDSLRWSMSVLVYRLSKILCAAQAPSQPVSELLAQDLESSLQIYPDLKAHETGLRRAIDLLTQLLQYAGWYSIDRVVMRTRPEFTDNIAPHQSASMQNTSKPHSSWGRPLPFRPLYCALGAFALAFPVRGDARRYEALPGEESILYAGGDDKPKVREDMQRTFATLLDACDYQVGHWKAHFKSEANYDASGKAYMGSPAQRPERKGNCYWRKPKGSISPDVVVVRQRHQAPDEANVTHVVDMKFGEDSVGFDQGQNYTNMFGKERFYVLYFPADCQAGEPEEAKQPDWVKVLMAILMLLLSRGRKGGRLPGQGPRPVPAH